MSRPNATASDYICYGSVSPFNIGVVAFSFGTGLVTTLSNLLLLCAIYRNPQRSLRTPSAILITNLVISDFLTGLVYCNIAGTSTYLRITANNCGLDVPGDTLMALFLFVNNFTITAMSIDRLIAVTWPLSYRTIVTNHRVLVLIACVWPMAALMASPIFINRSVKDSFEKFVYPHTHISIPLLFLTITYIYVFQKLKRQREHLQRNDERSEQSFLRKKKRIERDRRLAWTLIFVMCSFWLAALPYFIALKLFIGLEKGNDTARKFWQVASRFVVINSALDPLILATRLPNIREAVRIVLGIRGSRVGGAITRSVTMTDHSGDEVQH
ncbi:trace amine-associated receptor 9 [Nematostella vectensis]|uniref:trace amine-associated receptor 9 n=1 Tax=Nematostella vectensis TaxID=45351 RepID=UPI00207786AE|nr:trace amine-associated receptor 9 [Nematostella vectensis]